MKLVKVLYGNWDLETRDKREIATVLELGYDVEIICTGYNGKDDRFKNCKFKIRKSPDFSKMTNKMLRHIKMLGFFISFEKTIRKTNADIISAHDIWALGVSYLASKRMKNNPLLVYDSHEFELGRNTSRGKLMGLLIKVLEGFLIKRCAGSIMVNESIAQEVKRIYKLDKLPQVVRNIANYWDIDKEVCSQKREELCAMLGADTGTFLIMYHGAIMKNRGIETFIKIFSVNSQVKGVILGNGEKNYVESLKALAKQERVCERILFLPAVEYTELWKYVGAVDVGMVTIPNACQSYFYALPNKLFENVQGLTPVIGSDFPEIKKIVEAYKVGMVCNPDDLSQINECIEIMRNDKQKYEEYKRNLEKAKQELCWEREKDKLKYFYRILSK